MTPGGFVDQEPVREALRRLHREGRTGLVELRGADASTSLILVDGELYLPRAHPLAAEIANRVTPGDGGEDFLDRLLALMESRGEVRCVFEEGGHNLPARRVGPLPTRLWERVGGNAARHTLELWTDLATPGVELVADPEATTGALPGRLEAFLLSRLDTPATVDDLLRMVSEDRGQVVEALCRLHETGLLRRASERAPHGGREAPEEESAEASAAFTREVVRRFAEVIGRSLRERPLALPPEEHRRSVGDLLADFADMDHYQLLAVEPDVDPDDVDLAYRSLARLVHPAGARRLGLEGRSAALELLFEQATEAYLVLSDPERSREYARELGPRKAAPEPGEVREEERRKLARQHYDRALGLAAQEEPHYAVAMLEQAIRLDPQAEYHALLGRIQMDNPRWLHRAADSFSAAARASPEDLSHWLQLARVCESLGDGERAKRAYRRILDREPRHLEARRGLEALERAQGQGGLKGFLSQLRGRGEEED